MLHVQHDHLSSFNQSYHFAPAQLYVSTPFPPERLHRHGSCSTQRTPPSFLRLYRQSIYLRNRQLMMEFKKCNPEAMFSFKQCRLLAITDVAVWISAHKRAVTKLSSFFRSRSYSNNRKDFYFTGSEIGAHSPWRNLFVPNSWSFSSLFSMASSMLFNSFFDVSRTLSMFPNKPSQSRSLT